MLTDASVHLNGWHVSVWFEVRPDVDIYSLQACNQRGDRYVGPSVVTYRSLYDQEDANKKIRDEMDMLRNAVWSHGMRFDPTSNPSWMKLFPVYGS